MLKPLPVGIQTFRKIIEGGFLYVDKTRWIYELIRNPSGVYFLSRPRRFGKSLLISTLHEIFEGEQELFQGLWLYDSPYHWEQYPVIRIDFSQHRVESSEALKAVISRTIHDIAHPHQVTIREGTYTQQFSDLIVGLAAQNKVVILIDEYDKPIIDNIEDVVEAQRIRDVLKGFYTVIKSLDAYVRFVFLTGVSKFSQVGVFSGLNNLKDITMDNRFAALLGITQEEVETNFQDYIQAFAAREGIEHTELLSQIKAWYDGFCFSDECVHVYNPFSLLLLFDMQKFRNYWFESGTPTFLIKLIKQRNYNVPQLDQLETDELAFSSYEIEDLRVVALLFQTGYLTIKGYDKETQFYRLYYPNYEVEHAFLRHLLSAFSEVTPEVAGGYLMSLIHALRAGDLSRFFEILNVFFADIPYDIQLKKEKYYQTVFYLIFKLIGLRVSAEVRTSRGRIDAVVELPDGVFLFEFKLDGSEEEALQQIKDMEYFARYQLKGKTLHLVGVNFVMEQRGIASWVSEQVG